MLFFYLTVLFVIYKLREDIYGYLAEVYIAVIVKRWFYHTAKIRHLISKWEMTSSWEIGKETKRGSFVLHLRFYGSFISDFKFNVDEVADGGRACILISLSPYSIHLKFQFFSIQLALFPLEK